MLPLLIGDRIPLDDEYYELLLLLLQCLDIIYAPIVSVVNTVYLKHIIQEHHIQFKQLFPELNMINKHHHMIHYPLILQMAGPLVNMQCLKYELKHGFSKRLAAVNCNFRNIPKSVACKHQVMQCAVWNANEGLKGIECNGNLVSLDTLEGAETVRNSLGIDEDADCFVADWVTVFGTEYRPSMFLITAMENDMPQFCKICSILINGKSAENVRFVLKTVKTTGY